MKASWIVLGVLVGIPACGGKDEAASPEGTSGTKATDDKPKALSEAQQSVVDAWKKDGHEASLKAAAGFGKDCAAGTIDKLDVVICQYGNADEAKKAEQPGLDWVGTTTGAAWASGSVVIAVADRKKADPHGKTINQLMKSAPK